MDDLTPKAAMLERLEHSLQALACAASMQVELFPDFVAKTDELVLDFDHWRLCVLDNCQAELTQEQMASLATLDERFEAATSSGEKALWEEAALYSHPFWADVRSLAGQSLAAFGWPNVKPPTHKSEFAGGGRRQ